MESHLRRLLTYLWITAIIHVQGSLSQTPAFLEEPTDQEVNPGDNVDLKCRLNQQPSSPPMWLKDGQLQNTISGGVYTIVGDPANNDYSLRISGVQVDRDDGRWECQAFIPDHTGALSSHRAHVVVRQPPSGGPTMQFGNGPVSRNGEEVTVRADGNSSVTCTVRDSNPPATIKWWAGTKDITDSAQTINQTGGPNSKLYNTISTLTYQFQPRDNSGQLKCEISHPALAGSQTTSAHLNVLYAPLMSIQASSPGDFVEGQDVTLTCVAPANPPATVQWFQDGREVTMFNASSILLERVAHATNGNYTCLARNDGFEPVRMMYSLQVHYPPTITVQPQTITADAPASVSFFCDADGSPSPHIQWFQNTTDGQMLQRGEDRNLTIAADFSSQGKYWCRASNIINDKENVVLSDAADLFVKGPPIFDNKSDSSTRTAEVVASKGTDAILTAVYCSNPKPLNYYWKKETQRAPLSQNPKKYDISVKELPRAGCYESRARVMNLAQDDAGPYSFYVENEKGPNTYKVLLNVRGRVVLEDEPKEEPRAEPIKAICPFGPTEPEMLPREVKKRRENSNVNLIVGIVVGIGGPILLALLALLCCYRMRLLCFSSKKKSGNYDIEKREVKQDQNGTTTIETTKMVKDEALKQNPLQTDSMFVKEKKSNGTANHINGGMPNGTELPRKNGHVDGMPAEVLHYAQLDVDGPTENGHGHMNGSPRVEVRSARTEYTDIRPTVL